MIIPYSTDAPIYHFPYATIGLIVVNVLCYIVLSGNPEASQFFMLQFGNGLHPIEWFTSHFMHAGIAHLLGNMVFLWSFGIVVEGKLGWWKFLLTFMTIGVVESFIDQVIMLGAFYGHALGASGVIFGLLAMNFLWAPRNELSCFYFFFPFKGLADFSIQFFAMYYIGWEVLLMVLQGFQMSSALLHVIGALSGLAIAYIMLKWNWVDCEGWDWISLADQKLQNESMSPLAKEDKKRSDTKFKVKKMKSRKKKKSDSAKNQEKSSGNKDTWDLKKG